ncbi:MAG: carbohydrate binding family 9 domain-containing protein [candidate division Zixibacteria bacterium]|nr:carbohydrate binding family 9 domain-containing protein [candidate division Zixibacteria bacterium]
MLFKSILALMALGLLTVTGWTQTDSSFHPNMKPVLDMPLFTSEIKIDGDLSDPAWREAAVASNFAEDNPGDQVRPPVQTKVLTGYDENHLYLAFIAYDSPDAVRASMRDRDEIFNDDYIGMVLDTYGNGTWAYEIFLNPLGIQGDLRWNQNGSEDATFDIVFYSKGKVTDSGYQVEVSIPFSSLRFPDQAEQNWRATFWRNMPRESRYQMTWASFSRDVPCWPCQFGTLKGIKNVKAGSNFEVLPALTASQAGYITDDTNPRSPFHNDNAKGELSLNMRALASSNIVFDLAVNPDFSQVESDPGQIDVNSNFALFFEERRPFFQEGSDLYSTWVNAVYTRSINEPEIAGKMTAQLGRTSVAYFGARDKSSPIIIPLSERSVFVQNGKSTSNVFRIKQSLLEDSYIGALATLRNFDDGGSGALLSTESSLRFFRNYRLNLQLLASRIGEPNKPELTADVEDKFFAGAHTVALDGETYWGHAVFATLVRDARLWNANLTYVEYSPTFRTDNGFSTRNDLRRIELWSGLFFRPNGALIDEITPEIDIARLWNFRKERKDEWVMPMLRILFKSMTELNISYVWSRETYKNIYFPGINGGTIDISSNFSRYLAIDGALEWGNRIARNLETPVLGRMFTAHMSASFRPIQRIVISPEINYARMKYPDREEDIFNGYIFRNSLKYQFTRELMLRLIVEYDDFDKNLNVEPLLSYKINPFTIFYVGSSHGYHDYDIPDRQLTNTRQQFFLKFQYLFRV